MDYFDNEGNSMRGRQILHRQRMKQFNYGLSQDWMVGDHGDGITMANNMRINWCMSYINGRWTNRHYFKMLLRYWRLI